MSHSICFRCLGPIVQHPKTGLIWMHDNRGGHYAGQQMTHDAEPQRQYLVPIRFWETVEPIEVDLKSVGAEEWSAYVFHHGYGHTAYVRPADLFYTRELAIAEAVRRAAEMEVREKAEAEALADKIINMMVDKAGGSR